VQGLRDAALAFDRACRSAGVSYAFVGGIAVMAWGQPRATSDVDALVDLPEEGLQLDPRDVQDARADRSHVTVFHEASGFHVDMKLVETPAEREEIARGVSVKLVDGAVVVPPPEETVAYKLLFNSEQDLKDARSILVRQEGHLDVARLRELARGLGVADALEALLHETQE
jgi:hypothetical protein